MGFKKDRMLKVIFLSLVRLYQRYISPLLPRSCRYYPTCSEFAKEHLMKNHNVFYALYEIIKRIAKCNQLFDGGFDYPLIKKTININNLSKNKQNMFKVKYFYLKTSKSKYILIKAI